MMEYTIQSDSFKESIVLYLPIVWYYNGERYLSIILDDKLILDDIVSSKWFIDTSIESGQSGPT